MFTRLILFILTALYLIGCANSESKCGNKVLVLWPTKEGAYEFQEIVLTTLSSPYELSGSAAKVYFENALEVSGYTGPAAQPHFTQSGDTCVPTDAQSSMAVSTYAQIERLQRFEAELGDHEPLPWPINVGLDIHLAAVPGRSIHNNAHYFGGSDAIAVLPYSLKGLPLALNHGVLAHELFHAHFQRQVLARMDQALGMPAFADLFYPGLTRTFVMKPTQDGNPEDPRSPRQLNAFVLRAWNEGLADVYGAIYTGNPEFFTESLPQLAYSRALNSSVQRLENREDLIKRADVARDPSDLTGFSYKQGALLARLMYKMAESGVEEPKAFLARILRRLHAIPEMALANFNTEVLDIEQVVPVLLKGFPLNIGGCEALKVAVNKDTMLRSFSQCSVF